MRQLYCYRKSCWKRREQLIASLVWENHGAVWAMDFTEPPASIDAQYPWILVVRDLGTGLQLASLPVENLTCASVTQLLTSLFTRHGRPLVIKSDNGSGFIGLVTRQFLKESGVFLLLSP